MDPADFWHRGCPQPIPFSVTLELGYPKVRIFLSGTLYQTLNLADFSYIFFHHDMSDVASLSHVSVHLILQHDAERCAVPL